MDAFSVFSEVRANLGESVESWWKDYEILSKINQVQSQIYRRLSLTKGNWFISYVDGTGTKSITLPSNFSKIVAVRNTSSNTNVPVVGLSDVRLGTDEPVCTLYDNTLEFSTNSTNVRVYYQKKLSHIHFGNAGSGSGAGLLEFDSNNKPINQQDYYIGNVALITGSVLVTEISAYNGTTRIATIPGSITVSEGDSYGTVLELPDEAFDILVLSVTMLCLAKPSAALDTRYFSHFRVLLSDAMQVFESWINTRNVGHQFMGQYKQ